MATVAELKAKLKVEFEKLKNKQKALEELIKKKHEVIKQMAAPDTSAIAIGEYSKIFDAIKKLTKDIEVELKTAEKLAEDLEYAQLGFFGIVWYWIWAVISFPFRLLYMLIKAIIKKIKDLDEEDLLELLKAALGVLAPLL